VFEVRLTGHDWDRLRDELLRRRDVETKVFMLGPFIEGPTDGGAFIVREVVPVPEEAYERRTATGVVVRPEFVHGLLVRCAREGLSLLEAHTHPWAQGVRFSSIDRASDPRKFRATQSLSPPFRHGTMVFGGDLSFEGCLWDYRRQAVVAIERLKVIDAPLQVRWASPVGRPLDVCNDLFDRQIRAFGEEGQRRLRDLRVAVVGLGGLGSHIAQGLALMGVGHILLVDPDRLEASNANRMVGVRRGHFRRRWRKVKALAWGLRRLMQAPEVTAIPRSVLEPAAWWEVAARADVLVAGVDSARVRRFLNALAVAHLIPYLDAGVGLRAREGRIEAGGGQVQVVIPGRTACYTCLNPEVGQAVEEQMTASERRMAEARGYIRGASIPNPQVLFLNGVVAHMLLWELVKLVTGCGEVRAYVYYDLMRQEAFPVPDAVRREDCLVCSPGGWRAGGPAVVAGLQGGAEAVLGQEALPSVRQGGEDHAGD